MLFNPHKPFLGVQGAIPKNKARLAPSIGKVVGEKLLTPQDMLQELTHGGIRDAFNERVAQVAQSLLETERGSLRSLVPVTDECGARICAAQHRRHRCGTHRAVGRE